MKAVIDGKEHIVVYIDYRDGLPHDVKTIYYVDTSEKPYWRLCHWDFFPNNGDKTDLMAYHSGDGGSHKQIQAPHWAEWHIGEYWIHESAKFKGKVVNGKRLPKPKRIKGYFSNTSINPFKIAEVTHSQEYCEVCDYSSTEFCWDHKYEDEKGDAKYKHNNSYAD